MMRVAITIPKEIDGVGPREKYKVARFLGNLCSNFETTLLVYLFIYVIWYPLASPQGF